MFHYKLYLFKYPEGILCSGISGSSLYIYLNDKKIGTYYSYYGMGSKIYDLNYKNENNTDDLFIDKIGAELYELTLESEITDEMLQFDETTGLYGLIENLKLPPPDAKPAWLKK
jgi:hypothetical protein